MYIPRVYKGHLHTLDITINNNKLNAILWCCGFEPALHGDSPGSILACNYLT